MIQKLKRGNDSTILNRIIEGIKVIKAENRDVEEIILGMESMTELQMDLRNLMICGGTIKTNEMKLLGYSLNILSFLPHDYIGLRLRGI